MYHLIRNTLIIGTICLLNFAASAHEEQRLKKSPVSLIVEFNPTSAMISPALEGFEIRSKSWSYGTFSQDVDIPVTQTPNARVGLNFGDGALQPAVMAGIGYLGQFHFQSWFYTGELALRIRTGDRGMRIVPRVGLIHLGDATWDGQDDIGLDGDYGWFGGVEILQGGEYVGFSFGINYVNVDYSLDLPGDLQATDNNIDMSGLWLNLGITLKL